MKNNRSVMRFVTVAVAFAGAFFTIVHFHVPSLQKDEGPPDDWFIRQRAFPFEDVPYNARVNSLLQYKKFKMHNRASMGSPWTSVGPTNIGGRITALLIHPSSDNILIAGTADGGVWESTDFGATWRVIFDETMSIGALAMDRLHPDTMYVGTGEANSLRSTYAGDGVWRTMDGGSSWIHVGLDSTRQIGQIAIDLVHPNIVYVAAQGGLRMKNPQRGLYKTTDCGATWQMSLFMSDSAGATDIVIDPSNPQKLIAATWERFRREDYQHYGGAQSGLWMSTNAGTLWSQISGGFPENDPTLGRVALSLCENHPLAVYALAANADGTTLGVWKSTNGGSNWSSVYGGVTSSSYAWFNRCIAVDPNNSSIVYAGGITAEKTTDGGASWSPTFSGAHVDHHAWAISRTHPNIVVNGNDGGVFTSTNGGTDWVKCPNLPITQFYTCTIDPNYAYSYYGGSQDNGTSRTLTGSTDDWSIFYGGDGFYVLVDPTDPSRIYAEYQYGGLGYSTDGGSTFNDGRSGIWSTDRFNWSVPIVIDPNTPLTLYTGSHRIYRSTDGMASWIPISGDLTRGANGLMGTITTIDVAPANSSVIYVGTDDAKVWVTTNGGVTWQDVTGTLPMRWVTRVTADPADAAVAYVTLSGYKIDSLGSHIYRTANYGQSWQSISGNLFDIPVNDIIVYPNRPNTLLIATDVGVFMTLNGGLLWNALSDGMPQVPVHDLTYDQWYGVLLAATHGRSQYKMDLILDEADSVAMRVNGKWNLLSVPLTVGDGRRTVLFPNALSSAFRYDGGYSTADTLVNGIGYWLKFAGGQKITLGGIGRYTDTIDVRVGWNLIGSISVPVAVGSITSIPPAITTGNFFQYSNGYTVADTIVPGKGYWIKTTSAGTLILSAYAGKISAGKIHIVPSSELPPNPPDERLVKSRYTPPGFVLYQNYPNPFNPRTSIRFNLPEPAAVTLKIYDMLGQEVATLRNGNEPAGYRSAEWDATNSPSGIYFYRLQATSISPPGKVIFSQVIKMILLR